MLSSTSEYALRALADLAYSGKEESMLARTIASNASVPLQYLSKILGTLTKAGLLQASRGPKGGYRLARAPDEIPLIDVVELFDGVTARPECFFGGNRTCSDDDPCSAHEAFKQVRQGYIEFLESTTIADIAGPTHSDGVPVVGLPPGKAGGRT